MRRFGISRSGSWKAWSSYWSTNFIGSLSSVVRELVVVVSLVVVVHFVLLLLSGDLRLPRLHRSGLVFRLTELHPSHHLRFLNQDVVLLGIEGKGSVVVIN